MGMFVYKMLRPISKMRDWQPWTCRECGNSIKRKGDSRMDVRIFCGECGKETNFRRADLELEKEGESELREVNAVLII